MRFYEKFYEVILGGPCDRCGNEWICDRCGNEVPLHSWICGALAFMKEEVFSLHAVLLPSVRHVMHVHYHYHQQFVNAVVHLLSSPSLLS